MTFTLSLSTNPFVTRFAEPDDLIRTLAREVGIGASSSEKPVRPSRSRWRRP